MLNRWLFTQVHNSALILFRILFGALLAIEAFGAIVTGWVKKVFIDPQFTFNFIGFEFLQPLPGNGMLWYYGIMGIFGLFVLVGFKYRLSIFIYGVMWASVYLMQKSAYNNHYYLLMLLCFLMVLLPAHRYLSVDVWRNRSIRKIRMPRWSWLLLVLQMAIVYFYAAIAKIYPDWMDGTFIALLMKGKQSLWLIGDFLQQEWVHYTIAYFGFFFDLLIIPLLLYRKTRMPAFLASIFFHIFNSVVFRIGVFPYLALSLVVFFFPAKKINSYFLWKKPFYEGNELIVPNYKKPLLLFLSLWFLIQLALPLRHWFFKDDVLWTEEGHRLSWRMMLRSRSGIATFVVVDKATGEKITVEKEKYLSPTQLRSVTSKPDIIWQFAQRLEAIYAAQGREVEVYVDCRVSINGRPLKKFIDPKVDLAAEEWSHFSHSEWILPSPQAK